MPTHDEDHVMGGYPASATGERKRGDVSVREHVRRPFESDDGMHIQALCSVRVSAGARTPNYGKETRYRLR